MKLEEMFSNTTSKSKPGQAANKKQTLHEVLRSLPKEELVSILSNLADYDRTLKNNLLVKNSKSDDKNELQNCKKLMDSIVKQNTHKGGFINYREAGTFAREMESLLVKIRTTDNIILALDIAFLLLEEAINAF